MTADVLEPPGSRLAPRFVPEQERAFQARRYADISLVAFGIVG
jgi:hypothetical protein